MIQTALEHAFSVLCFPENSMRGVACVQLLRPSFVAEITLKHFDVKKLGDELAVLALCDIAVDVPFNDDERDVRQRLVTQALRLLTETLGINPYELNVDEATGIQHKLLVQRKTVDGVRALFKGSGR